MVFTDVILAARDEERGTTAQNQLRDAGYEVEFHPLDMYVVVTSKVYGHGSLSNQP